MRISPVNVFPSWPNLFSTITGYLLIQADSLEQAQALMAKIPVHKSGGTVGLFALMRT